MARLLGPQVRGPAADLAVALVSLIAVAPPRGTVTQFVPAAAVCLPLLLRRRYPLAVFAVVLAVTTVVAAGGPDRPHVGALLFALGTLAWLRRGAVSLPALAVALGTLSPLMVRNALPDQWGADLSTLASLHVAAWAVGAYLRARQQTLAALRQRAEHAERDRDLVAALAADRERLRISRELHDVVGHALSVVVAVNEGARAVLRRDPDRADAALARGADAAREALTEMRSFVRSAREETFHGRDGIDRLVADSRAAGVAVTTSIEGDVDALSPALRAGLHRVVQESLTNALRHGGPGVRVDVRVAASSAAVNVAVTSVAVAGRRRPDAAGQEPGTGLVAMAERVGSLGGTLRHGWTGPRTFEVAALLPLREPVETT